VVAKACEWWNFVGIGGSKILFWNATLIKL